MNTQKKVLHWLAWLGVVIIQIIMTQVVTFVVSLFVPQFENIQQDRPWLFATILCICFSAGIFLAGWLAIRRGWLSTKHRYPARLVAVLFGVYLPLAAALFLHPMLEPGNPSFGVSILAGVLGFHLPGWLA